MAKAKKLDRTQIIVAVIAAIATLVAAYWRFVWEPSHPSPSTPSSQQIEYVGRVLDSNTNEPVPNAKVTLYFQGAPLIVYTDTEGIFRFTFDVESDKITGQVRVDADKYEIYDRNITLLPDDPNIEDIRLAPL